MGSRRDRAGFRRRYASARCGWCAHAGKPASQWATIMSILEKIGCTAETLRSWLRQAERDAGQRAGLTTDERARLKVLERENVELRRERDPATGVGIFRQGELDRTSATK